MKEIKRADFVLKKIKVSKEGVEADYSTKESQAGKKTDLVINVKRSVVPHPEFLMARDAFKEILMRSLGKWDIYEEASKYLKGGQLEKVRDVMLDKVNETEVTGISLSGQDQMKGIIISGKEKNKMDGNSAINSPRIVFSSDKLGSEKQAEALWEQICDEAWEYLIKDKKAQLELFDEANQQAPKRGPGRPRKEPAGAEG